MTKEVLTVNREPDNQNMADTSRIGQADQPEPQLASEIVGLYPPVHPELVFRQQLYDGLVETMGHRSKLHIAEPAERRRWALIAGATLGSLVPLLGVAAYYVRSRLTGRAQHAVSH